ncbi:hypothetical protein SDC9_58695 [bioreactor metagenome]|uniref:Uncharacterized protein n=2 Tax=root TaxID=1 RepID=A0A644X858_9ZZZZ
MKLNIIRIQCIVMKELDFKMKFLGPFVISIGVVLIVNSILKSYVTNVSSTGLIFGILILLIGIIINIKSKKKEN